MKIRKGFVSNSSSSSFVLIGKELHLKEEIYECFNNTNKKLVSVGGEGDEGPQVTDMKDQEILDVLFALEISGDYKFFEAKFLRHELYSPVKLPEGITPDDVVYAGTCDQSSLMEVEQIFWNYWGEEQKELERKYEEYLANQE